MIKLIIENTALSLFWLASAFGDYLNYLYIWQLKEYRNDRFSDFSKSKQGINFWLGYSVFWRAILALFALFFLSDQTELLSVPLFIFFGVDIIRFATNFYSRNFRRPKFTEKSILILAIALLSEGIIIFISKSWVSLYVMLALRFFLISGVVFVMTVPTIFLKKIYKILATRKIKKFPNLIVIGITGSYGKSSVKYFLSSILSSKYNVAYTPGNINTDIGVAKYILKHDFSKIDIFIVEMGAYRIGEIESICKIVEPNIGILTAINEQHLSLFGDIKITQKAKYELLRSLGSNDLAVVNADNKYCTEYLSELPSQKLTFGAKEENKPDCLIKSIEAKAGSLVCDFQLSDGKDWKIISQLLGEHNCFNLAPCVLVAKYLGLEYEKIAEAAKELQNIQGKLQVSEYGNSLIIDDSANSNPEGFTAALAVLRTFPSSRRRIVITRGMLELGSQSPKIHEEIGEEISISADELVVISQDSAEFLEKGVGTRYKTVVKKIYDVDQLVKYVMEVKKGGVVILLENKIPAQLITEIFGQL